MVKKCEKKRQTGKKVLGFFPSALYMFLPYLAFFKKSILRKGQKQILYLRISRQFFFILAVAGIKKKEKEGLLSELPLAYNTREIN